MSSPLDGRIRHIAREVLAEAGGTTAKGLTDGIPADGDDRLASVEEQLTALTARVEELEKAPAPTARRTSRKTTAETSE